MKSRSKVASILLVCALLLSFVPAAITPAQAAAQTTCDRAQFVADVTVPDGTTFQPGAAFKKTWRLKNIGSCTWTTSYQMVYVSGTQMGSTTSVNMPSNVAPGQTVDVSVDMTAPNAAGNYISYWKFKNASGVLFGIGSNANSSWWVSIRVTGSTQTGVVYDFGAQAESAAWSSGAGGLTFPGTDGDAKGFALRIANAKYESGALAKEPTLLVGPQQVSNGYIQGRYADFTVQNGDRFQTTVGCAEGATSCYVTFRLDYEVGGTVRTFWSFRERFEGLTYNANINLSPLAGQTVKFILHVNAYGSPVGDRALWGNPVIVRQGVTPPPTFTGTPATSTPTRTPGPVTVTVAPSSCDRAQFVADVTVPDGTVMNPGQTFTKTWRLKNLGPCAWNKSYQLVFVSGEQMGAPASAAFPKDVAVGQTVDLSVNMTAPSAAGSYRGYWMFKNANGVLFGIGAQANKPWWVDIKVSGPTVTPGGPTRTPTATPTGPTPTPNANSAYDFVANACFASWFSGAGGIDCTGSTDNDPKGFVLKVSNPRMESGATDPRPALLVGPQNVNNGYIQGIYPPFRVQNGDRFRANVNCEYGATSCYVVFRLEYQVGNEPIRILQVWPERYEGGSAPADVNLSQLAGRDVKFILTVLSYGPPTGDRALWVGPHIYRVSGSSDPGPAATPLPGTSTATATATTAATTGTATATPTATATLDTTTTGTSTPTATATQSTSGTTYQNTKYNFKFTLPTGARIVNQSDNAGRVSLPLVVSGTNLQEKYIAISIQEGKNPCIVTDMEGGLAVETVTINGTQFSKQSGQGVAAGSQYDWRAYSTIKNNACIIIAFVLHSTNPGNYATQPPVFDPAKEAAVIDAVMNTYAPVAS